MSCFAGKLLEYPEISLDRFDNDNLSSTVYFLSHCHSDHMQGLDEPKFLQRLVSSSLSNHRVSIYCHDISAALLKGSSRYEQIMPFVERLAVDEMCIIPVLNDCGLLKYEINVTLISAGHCPGSVMFLIQGPHGTVLYTGDFRIALGDITRVRSLFSPDGKSLHDIKSCYVDTTFCVPQAKFFPSRRDCLDVIVSTCSDWLKRKTKDFTPIIYFQRLTNYGYENLMISLAKRFQCKIHVSEFQAEHYRYFDDVFTYLTTNPNETSIHFCKPKTEDSRWKKKSILPPCLQQSNEKIDERNVLKLKPSAMFFTKSFFSPAELITCVSEQIIRVCYSTHSSYEEVVDFLKHLKPENIYPNVIPNGIDSLKTVRCNLQFLERSRIGATSAVDVSSNETCTNNKIVFRNMKKRSSFVFVSESETNPKSEELKKSRLI